jgi:hypothetical protein
VRQVRVKKLPQVPNVFFEGHSHVCEFAACFIGAGNCSTVVECDEPEEDAAGPSGHGSMCDTSLHSASTDSVKTVPQSCKFTPKQWTILVVISITHFARSKSWPPFHLKV